jgi:hypothetical protein
VPIAKENTTRARERHALAVRGEYVMMITKAVEDYINLVAEVYKVRAAPS